TAEIEKLIRHGARQFIVINLPDLAKVPRDKTAEQAQRWHQLTVAHNAALATRLHALQAAYPDVKLVSLDMYYRFNDLETHPEKYNKKYGIHIKNTHTACWKGGAFIRNMAVKQAMNKE